MSRRDYYQQLHKKELKTFNIIAKKIIKGLLLITHCSFEKLSVGDGYRFIVYLRGRE